MAMAAALAIGVVAGSQLVPGGLSPQPSGAPAAFRLAAGAPVADGATARLLSTVASGAGADLDGARLEPLLSFRDEEGRLCRQLRVSGRDTTLDALACHDGRGWRIEALATRPAATGGYVTAAGPDEGPVAEAVGERIAGEPLDAAAEAAALAGRR